MCVVPSLRVGWGGGGGRRASERTHLDRKERDGGRPLLALPLGLSGTRARDPRVPWPLSIGTTGPALLPL